MSQPRALVIGGRRGIGAAVVGELLARGYDVTFTRRAGTQPAGGSEAPPDGTRAISLDLADRGAVEAFAIAQEDAEAFSVLVQVSGTTYDALAAMVDQDAAERAMQVNYHAFVRIARAVIRPMLRARAGRIIAIGSVAGQVASQGNAAYGATKAALLAYVKTLAIESARRGVTVNYIAPGFVDTAMLAPFAAHRAATEARIPAGRYGRAEEVAALAGFLASPGASYITGAYIPVDGGLTASLGIPRG